MAEHPMMRITYLYPDIDAVDRISAEVPLNGRTPAEALTDRIHEIEGDDLTVELRGATAPGHVRRGICAWRAHRGTEIICEGTAHYDNPDYTPTPAKKRWIPPYASPILNADGSYSGDRA